jgi:cell wall-associated NlpC family hydrolase
VVTCDGGDGLPGDGGAGIPPGFQPPTNAQQAIAVAFALSQLGKPYVFGAAGPDAYDCSGLVMAAWAHAGVRIPRVTTDQVHTGIAVTSLAAMQPGDLIFIPGSDGTRAAPGHVGMYIGAVAGRQYLVQAPHTGTVVQVSPVSSWASEIVAIRRP